MALTEQQITAASDEWLQRINNEAILQARHLSAETVKRLAASMGAVSFHLFMEATEMEVEENARQKGQGGMEDRQRETGIQNEEGSTQGSESNLRQEE